MQEVVDSVRRLVSECRNDNDIDRQVSILIRANAMLPPSMQLKIPSLITADYIRKALSDIEEQIEAIPTT
ncbi:hypothetical protein NTE_02399 [Candidatus Nitrososphaera evergladensis SR1]|jgi:hypothetical protein|uniref:Uncharacterized protein n=1 Tax=Candidatus Nitrososphaera evergladensis SR1 TaxID=1459636 RepID=A0A075MSA3_9ARCH|nr:hypothetical protein [Candidatus Nitrososphaera evergladensis]AIF84451.1 hypothetical protein NTE_02399 [Candidatus Nitrososphaera evergladensis SR1]